MGSCQSSDVKAQVKANKQIDRDIRKDRRQQKIKLLLLGTADSGKSTVLKQMRILHDQGFKPEEIERQKSVVFTNIVRSMGTLIHALDTYEFDSNHLQSETRLIQEVLKSGRERQPFSGELHAALKKLWADVGIQEMFVRKAELGIPDTVQYFLDDLDRIAASDYTPTSQDILYTRAPTNGIVEVRFFIKMLLFRVFDVGGQRSERRKWIHCFDDVNSVIFITSCSEYDQQLQEDNTMNRMQESLALFGQIANSKWFSAKASMILFMNKKDLFQQKIKLTPITRAFPDYTGRQDYEESLKYIEQRYEKANEMPDRDIYVHRTCATDTNQVQLVLDAVMDMIVQANLSNSGLVNNT